MRYVTALLVIALATSVSAQTPEIEALKSEAEALNHRIQKLTAAHNFAALTLDSELEDLGYSISADTLDAGYLVFTMPEDLTREAVLVLREWGSHGLPYIKTSDENSIRIGRQIFRVIQEEELLHP